MITKAQRALIETLATERVPAEIRHYCVQDLDAMTKAQASARIRSLKILPKL